MNRMEEKRVRLETILTECFESGLFTHAYVECGSFKSSEPAFSKFSSSRAIESNRNIFDLASLTKALVTTPLVHDFLAEKELDGYEPIEKWFKRDDLPSFKERILRLTPFELLSHRSGVPAWRNFWINRLLPGVSQEDLIRSSKDHITEVLNRVPIKDVAIERDLYSDIGFILLGFLLEKARNKRLDVIFTEFVKKHSDKEILEDLQFSTSLKNVRDRAISSGRCEVRSKELIGEVHDENCAALGSICGHAGLFGSGEAVSRYLRSLYNGPYFDRMTTKDSKGSMFGWRPGDDYSSIPFGNGNGVGHMGFTGTAFWVEPKLGVYAIFLSNRIISGRISKKIKETRHEVFRILFSMVAD